MKKSKFHYFLALAAFSTAAVAAYFSVTGLGKLFAGASLSIMIMAGVLEFAKLVVASYVYRFWDKIKFLEKSYLIIALAILMTITSAGIYGYLSGAYSETSSKLQVSQGEISLLDKKKEQFKERIVNTEENISKKNTRITSLNNLRATQEGRLDSLYARKTYKQAKVVEGQIKDADIEIKKLTRETDSLLNVVNLYNEEVSKLDLGATEKIAENLKGEAAPLQYIATLFGTTMDKVVNFFMFLLIFVCDPLAIILVIATNKVIVSNSESETTPEIITEKIIKEEEIFENKADLDSEKNTEESVVEYADETQKKKDEVIQYVTDEQGEFKAVPSPIVDEEKEKIRKVIMDQIKTEGIEHNANYLSFLNVLFKNGTNQVGAILPSYNKFLEELQFSGIEYTEREVKSFLTICNLFKITDMSGLNKKIAKEYTVAREIISLLSK
jgi:hypothetical protein